MRYRFWDWFEEFSGRRGWNQIESYAARRRHFVGRRARGE